VKPGSLYCGGAGQNKGEPVLVSTARCKSTLDTVWSIHHNRLILTLYTSVAAVLLGCAQQPARVASQPVPFGISLGDQLGIRLGDPPSAFSGKKSEFSCLPKTTIDTSCTIIPIVEPILAGAKASVIHITYFRNRAIGVNYFITNAVNQSLILQVFKEKFGDGQQERGTNDWVWDNRVSRMRLSFNRAEYYATLDLTLNKETSEWLDEHRKLDTEKARKSL
jgi:hypothetical protein